MPLIQSWLEPFNHSLEVALLSQSRLDNSNQSRQSVLSRYETVRRNTKAGPIPRFSAKEVYFDGNPWPCGARLPPTKPAPPAWRCRMMVSVKAQGCHSKKKIKGGLYANEADLNFTLRYYCGDNHGKFFGWISPDYIHLRKTYKPTNFFSCQNEVKRRKIMGSEMHGHVGRLESFDSERHVWKICSDKSTNHPSLLYFLLGSMPTSKFTPLTLLSACISLCFSLYYIDVPSWP